MLQAGEKMINAMKMQTENKTTLEMKNISVEFPGVKALSDVNFSIASGEIHALVGANGAGKSTLMKVLSGVNSHYTGQILIDNQPYEIRSPKEAKNLGIEIVYQEVDVALVHYLTVAENIMLNTLANKMDGKTVVKWKDIYKIAGETLNRLNVKIDTKKLVSELSLAEKQMVLIARAVVEKCRFLVLDEPTAPLSNTETQELFKIVRQLSQEENVGIIFISHRLNELFEICNHISIMRDGKMVQRMPLTSELTIKQIVEYMLGRSYDENYPKCHYATDETMLEVKGLTDTQQKIRDVSFEVRRGEIVAIAGLVGAGKTELCKTLFGAMEQASGEIVLNGKKLQIKDPRSAVRQGLALVPEERRKEGVLVEDPVYANITIAALNQFCNKLSIVKKSKQKETTRRLIDELGIKTPSENQKVALLSGGNQQKVAVGKWLLPDCEIYIFDEPTKGVDVGAKTDIFHLIEDLVARGKGVIYSTCEFSEILAIADRAYVMYDGRITKELSVPQTNEKELLYYSTGGH